MTSHLYSHIIFIFILKVKYLHLTSGTSRTRCNNIIIIYKCEYMNLYMNNINILYNFYIYLYIFI